MKLSQLPTVLSLSWHIQHPKRRHAWAFTATGVLLSWSMAFLLSRMN